YPQHPPPATPNIRRGHSRLVSPSPFSQSSSLPAVVLLSCTRTESVGNLNRLQKIGSSRLRAILHGMVRIDGTHRFFSRMLPKRTFVHRILSSTCHTARRHGRRPMIYRQLSWRKTFLS